LVVAALMGAAILLLLYPGGAPPAGPSVSALQQMRHLLPLGIVGLLSWSVWLVRVTMSKFYRPVPVGYRTSTSVVVR
jgi:hypothetical protein